MRGAVRTAAVAATLIGAALPVPGGIAAVKPEAVPSRVLVGTYSGIQPIAAATGVLETPISDAGAEHVVVTPDGKTAFAAKGTVVRPITLKTGTVGAAISGLVGTIKALALSPDGRTLYVTSADAPTDGAAVYSLTAVNVKTEAVDTPISLPDQPRAGALAIAPNGKKAYIGVSGELAVVNLNSKAVTSTVNIGTLSVSIQVTPDGKTVWVLGIVKELVPFNPVTGLGTAIPLPDDPADSLAIAPDGVHAFVSLQISGKVVPINLSTRTAGTGIAVRGAQDTSRLPFGVGVTADGNRAYVADYVTDQVTPITLPAGSVGVHQAVSNPQTVVATPDQPPVAKLKASVARAGKATVLDAGGSYAQSAPIASYVWRFGDGTGTTTTKPSVKHVYKQAGKHVASVRLIDSAGTSTTRVFTGQSVLRNGSAVALATLNLTIKP